MIPEEDLSPREQEELAHKDALYHANELACRYFQGVLESEQGDVNSRNTLSESPARCAEHRF